MVKLDPKHDGSTVRTAFLLEAIANLLSFPLITHPALVLRLLLAHPSQINPASILFARLFGGVVVGFLTPTLLYGYRNTKRGIESRKVTYLALGLGEVVLIPLLLGEASKPTSQAALTSHAAIGATGLLLPPLLWRLYVLGARPDMLGRYTELKRE
jgi:hypothetical protein